VNEKDDTDRPFATSQDKDGAAWSIAWSLRGMMPEGMRLRFEDWLRSKMGDN